MTKEVGRGCNLPSAKVPGCSLPVTKDPGCSLPVTKDPGHLPGAVTKDPGCSLPVTKDPGHLPGAVTKDPGCSLPVTKDPGCSLPVTKDPGHLPGAVTKDPGCSLPVTKDPGCSLPVTKDPGHLPGAVTKDPGCSLPVTKDPGCSLPSAVVVVAAGFCINGIYNGVFFVSGLYLQAFMDTFRAGKVTTAWVISLHGCFVYFSGLVAGPLIARFGTRRVAVAGSLCSTLGLFLSAFAVHISWLYVSYGLLTSFGFGILMITNAVCVQQHTKRRRALAAGIAFSGTGAGTMIMPHIVRWAMDTYSWRGSLLILAGTLLHTLPCALLLRPPKHAKPQTHSPESIQDEKGAHVHTLLLDPMSDDCDTHQSKSKMKQEIVLPKYNQKVSNSSLTGSVGSVDKRLDVNNGSKNSIYHFVVSPSPPDDKIQRSSLVYSSATNSNEVPQQEMLLGNRPSSGSGQSNAKSITKILKDTMVPTRGEDISVNFILVVVMIIGAYFFWIAGFPVVYVFSAVKARAIGLSTADSAMLLSACGLGELVGRVLGAVLGTCHEKMPLVIFSLNLVLSGLSCASVSVCVTYIQMVIAVLAFGVTIGLVSGMCTTVVRDLVGIHHLPWVVSYAFTAGGIGYIFSIEILALIWEVTNAVFIPFLIGGGFLVAAGLLTLAAKLTHRKDDMPAVYTS